MNSEEIFELLERIGATSSTKEKQRLLEEHKVDALLKTIISAAVDPTYIYGLVPSTSLLELNSGTKFFDHQTIDLVSDLKDRVLTGNAARDALNQELTRLNRPSAELLIRIIRKDLRAGFSDKIANKVWSGLIPEYPYMRCSLPKSVKLDKFDWKGGVISQMKMDGLYANINIEEDQQTILTRNGLTIPEEYFSNIISDLMPYPGYQFQGEFLVQVNGQILPRTTGNGIITSVIKGGSFEEGQTPLFVVWDMIPLAEVKAKNKYNVPYVKRLELLQSSLGKSVSVKIVESRTVYSFKDALLHAKELIALGHEGTVFKDRHALWEDGTSKFQVKIKIEVPVDLEVVEVLSGKKDTKTEGRAGALRCRTSCGQLYVKVAIKNEKMRDIVDANPQDWIGRIVSVVSNDVILAVGADTHSLFLPRLAEDVYRVDKQQADTLDQVREQFSNCIETLLAQYGDFN